MQETITAALLCSQCGIPVEDEGLCVQCWDAECDQQAAYRQEHKAQRAAYGD